LSHVGRRKLHHLGNLRRRKSICITALHKLTVVWIQFAEAMTYGLNPSGCDKNLRNCQHSHAPSEFAPLAAASQPFVRRFWFSILVRPCELLLQMASPFRHASAVPD
jgi:hypothetical protein